MKVIKANQTNRVSKQKTLAILTMVVAGLPAAMPHLQTVIPPIAYNLALFSIGLLNLILRGAQSDV